MSEKTIALLGQPNSGKSTLFNGLTGSRQHVGNWPGKTVERKDGSFVHKIPPIKSLIFRELIACLQIRMKKLLHGIT